MLGMNSFDIEGAMRCLSVGTVDVCHAGTVFTGPDGEPAPIPASREVAEFLQIAKTAPLRLTFGPDVVGSSSPFVVTAQFPQGGELVAPGSEVILEFVEIPIEPVS
jgi:hypothetical protein